MTDEQERVQEHQWAEARDRVWVAQERGRGTAWRSGGWRWSAPGRANMPPTPWATRGPNAQSNDVEDDEAINT